MHTRSALFAAVGVILTTAASAGPLDKSRVPADVSWLVHFDAEAVLRSSVAKAILQDCEHLHMDELGQIKDQFGIDPLNDVKDATVFGTDTDGDDAVAIVTTTPAIDDAIEKLRAKGLDYAMVKDGPYELYSWTDDGQTQFGLVREAGADRRLVYLSKDKARLVAAADVGRGRGESLRGRKGSALSGEPGAGAMLFVATDVMPSDRRHGEASMVLEKATALRLEVGEDGENCYATGELTMASREDATNVVQILLGLQAVARMLCQNNPDLAPLKELLNAESVEAKGEAIVAQVRFPTAKVIEAIKAAEAEEDRDDDDDDEDGDDEGHHKNGRGHGEGHHGKKPL